MDELQQPLLPDSLKRFFSLTDRFLRKLAEKPLSSLSFVLLLILFLYGFRSTQTDYFKRAQAPFEPYNGASYTQDSIFLPLSAYYLGLNKSQFQFDFYAACAYLLALASIYFFGYRKFRPELVFFLAMALAISPVSLISFSWPGMPDAFTVLFSVFAVFSNSIPLLFMTALLGVLNHPQFLLIGVSLAILRLSAQEKNFKALHALALIAGTMAGYGVAQAFLAYNQITIYPSRLQLMFEQDISYWLEAKLAESSLSIFSLYQGLWLILPICFLYGFSRQKPYYIVFLLCQAAAGLTTLFVLDTTRIFSLLTIGTILHAIAFTYNSIDEKYLLSLRWLFTASFLLAIFLPHYVIMSGEMYIPPAALIPYLIFSVLFGQ